MIPVSYYLVVSAILFITGAIGVLLRRNALIMLMSLELMVNAVNLSFIAYARMFNDISGHVFVFFSITVAAAEAAVGLANPSSALALFMKVVQPIAPIV